MPDRIKLDEGLGIIAIQSYGPVTCVDIMQSIEKVQQIRKEANIDEILVDTTAQKSLPSTIDLLEIFSNFPRAFRVAMFIKESQVTQRDIRFIETVAVNRGIFIRIFSDREEAVQWLKS